MKGKKMKPIQEEWGNIELPGLSDEKLLNTNWNRVEGVRRAYQDPKVRQKQCEKFKGKTVKPEVRKRLREANLGKVRKGQAWIAGMAEKKKGNTAHNKPFMTPIGAFPSKKLAADWAKEHGVSNPNGKFDRWIKTRPTEFYYISKEEFEKVKKKKPKIGLEWMNNVRAKRTKKS